MVYINNQRIQSYDLYMLLFRFGNDNCIQRRRMKLKCIKQIKIPYMRNFAFIITTHACLILF